MAAPVVEQVITATANNETSMQTGTWTVSADDFVIVMVATKQGDEPTTPTFNGSDLTFTKSSWTVESGQGQVSHGIWYGKAGSTSFGAVNVGGLTSNKKYACHAIRISGAEVTGTNGGDALEATAIAHTGATDTANASVNITTLTDDALVVGFASGRSTNWAVGSGYTAINLNLEAGTGGGSSVASSERKTLATAGSTAVDWTNGAQDWIIWAGSIKPSGGGGQTIAVGQSSETDSIPGALTWTKVMAVGLSTETDTAQVVTPLQPIIVVLGQSTETDTGQVVTWSKALTVGQSVETDTGQAVTWSKVMPVAQATEADTAQAVGWSKVMPVGQASETDTAQAVTPIFAVAVGQATETDTAQAVTWSKVLAVGQANETDTAQPVTAGGEIVVNVVQATETDTSQAVSWSKVMPVGQSTESDVAQAMTWAKSLLVAQTTETDTAQSTTWSKVMPVTQATESDLAQAVASAKLYLVGLSSETDAAQSVSPIRVVNVGQATEADTATAISWSKILALGLASETDTALSTTLVSASPEVEIGILGETFLDAHVQEMFADVDMAPGPHLDPDITHPKLDSIWGTLIKR